MKTLSVLLIIPIFFFGRLHQYSKTISSEADSTLVQLKLKRNSIDKYVYKHQKEMVVLVKVVGKKALISVKNDNWPDNTDYIYNILKDSTGRIIMIAQIPYSESGDWYLEYKHYFDDNGKTFAFSKRETLFDDGVKGGVAVEEFLKYYDVDHKLIKQTFRLTDKDDKTINRNKSEFNFRNDKYATYSSIKDCLMAYHITLQN